MIPSIIPPTKTGKKFTNKDTHVYMASSVLVVNINHKPVNIITPKLIFRDKHKVTVSVIVVVSIIFRFKGYYCCLFKFSLKFSTVTTDKKGKT